MSDLCRQTAASPYRGPNTAAADRLFFSGQSGSHYFLKKMKCKTTYFVLNAQGMYLPELDKRLTELQRIFLLSKVYKEKTTRKGSRKFRPLQIPNERTDLGIGVTHSPDED